VLFAEAFVTMLVILDPVGNVPVFLALTKDHDARRRRRASLEATAVAASVILVFAAFGQQILQLLGISLQALQVAGGLVLVLVALELLQPTPSRGHSVDVRNPALVPLGTPLLAGPGAIAATMVYIRRADDFVQAMVVVVAIMAALAVVYFALRSAVGLARVLGSAGIELLTRIVGVLLAAIAVQLVASGIDSWVRQGV
jgi:multiple antibiotic resistance protein